MKRHREAEGSEKAKVSGTKIGSLQFERRVEKLSISLELLWLVKQLKRAIKALFLRERS